MAASVWDFNVNTDVDACDCTRGGGCTDTVQESALEVDSGRKENPMPHRGLEPVSVLRLAFHSDAVPTELSPFSRCSGQDGGVNSKLKHRLCCVTSKKKG